MLLEELGPYNYFVTGVNGYNNSELNNLGTTSVSFNVVEFGIYQINVVDFNGCSVLIQNVKVASPPDDLDISVIPPPADCSTSRFSCCSSRFFPTSVIGTDHFISVYILAHHLFILLELGWLKILQVVNRQHLLILFLV